MNLIPAVAALLVLGLAESSAIAQHPAAPPLAPEQAELLAQARHAALAYSESLPDFICTQVVRRTEYPRGDNRGRMLDTLTIKLTYFEHHEEYKLMLINGRATVLDYFNTGGALSTGEFGSRLLAVFHSRSAAEFAWKGPAKLRKRKVAVFTYHVPKETSSFRLQFGQVPVGPNNIVAAYHGEVFVDEETHMVLRLTQQAEIPAGFPISANASEIDYDYAPVGGKPFLLPVRAHVTTRSGNYKAENDVDFKEYRKFNTEATITFGAEDEKPKSPDPKK